MTAHTTLSGVVLGITPWPSFKIWILLSRKSMYSFTHSFWKINPLERWSIWILFKKGLSITLFIRKIHLIHIKIMPNQETYNWKNNMLCIQKKFILRLLTARLISSLLTLICLISYPFYCLNVPISIILRYTSIAK